MTKRRIMFGLFISLSFVLLSISFAFQNDAYAKDMITINIHETVIAPDQRLFVQGMILTDEKFYEPIILTMYDSTGLVIFEPRLWIEDNERFSTVFTPPIGHYEIGAYSIHASHPSVQHSATVDFKVVVTPSLYSDNGMLLSPRAQLSVLSIPEHVQCEDGLILMENLHRYSVACVLPTSSIELIDRGWGITL